MSRALAIGVLLSGALAVLPGCLTISPVTPPTPPAEVTLEIDGQARPVVPMVISKGRYFMAVRPAQGFLSGFAGAKQANLPADTYAFDLTLQPRKPDAGYPVGDGLPAEPGFSREEVTNAELLITGPDADTFFFEKLYFDSEARRRFPTDGLILQAFTFYQTSGVLNGVFEDTLQSAPGQPAFKVRITFKGLFPQVTTH